MKKLDVARQSRLCFAAVFFLAGIIPWLLYAQTPSPELIVDICTTPHRYWNKYVMLKGHIRSATANPPGSNRGSYVMRDSSDSDITVLTTDLPALGKEYTVYGNVEQTSLDAKIPVIREFRRASGTESTPRQTTARPRREAPPEEAAPETAPAPRREPAKLPEAPPIAVQPAAPPIAVQPTAVPAALQPESSGMSTGLMIGIVGLVALIVIVIVIVVMRPKTPAPAPAPASYARPIATAAPAPIRPPTPPPPTAGRTVNAAPRSAATQVVPPPAPKATEVYFDLGMELLVTDGPDRGKKYPITKLAITMGRSGARQNDITLSDGTVSREHAKIIYAASEKVFRLINESTTNPARLNGNPIDAAAIKEGDVIQIGSTILKFSKKA